MQSLPYSTDDDLLAGRRVVRTGSERWIASLDKRRIEFGTRPQSTWDVRFELIDDLGHVVGRFEVIRVPYLSRCGRIQRDDRVYPIGAGTRYAARACRT